MNKSAKILKVLFLTLAFVFCFGFKAEAASVTKVKIIKISATSQSEINIKWKRTGKKPSGFQVYRKTGPGKWTKIKTTKSTSFSDKELASGVKYYYKVRGYKIYKKHGKRKYQHGRFSAVKSVSTRAALKPTSSPNSTQEAAKSDTSTGFVQKLKEPERIRYSYRIRLLNRYNLYDYSQMPSVGVLSSEQVAQIMARDTNQQRAILYVETQNPYADQFDDDCSHNKSALLFKDHVTGKKIMLGYNHNITLEYNDGYKADRGFETDNFLDVNYLPSNKLSGCYTRGRRVSGGFIFTFKTDQLSAGNSLVDMYEGGDLIKTIDLHLIPIDRKLQSLTDEMIAGGMDLYYSDSYASQREIDHAFWLKRFPTDNQNYFKLCCIRDYIKKHMSYSPCVGTSLGNQVVFKLATYGQFVDTYDGGCEVGSIVMCLCAAKLGVESSAVYKKGHCICLLSDPVRDLEVIESEANDWCEIYDATPDADDYYDMDSETIQTYYAASVPIM